MKIPLNLKVTGFIVALMLSLGLMSTAFYLYSYKEGIRKEFTARGIAMAESLAMSVDEALATENLDLIDHVQRISYAKDVVLAQVYTTLWFPVDAYPRSDRDIPPDPVAVKHFEKNQTSFVQASAGRYDFYCPVFFRQFSKSQGQKYIIGYVRLQLSSEQAMAATGKTLIYYVSIFLLVTVTAITTLTMFLQKTVLKPLLRLKQSVSLSAHEDLPAPVPIQSTDEIGELSTAYNFLCTALRQREERLLKQNELLEKEIAERTQAEEALQAQALLLEQEVGERKAREGELELKNAELERFTYTVSHDLKSPLITIKGFSGSVLKDAVSGRYDRLEGDVRRITEAADKMSALLSDLLELSRIGRITNPTTRVDMGELTTDALAQLAGPISQKQVEIVVQPGMPAVVVDKSRMSEVVQNLIENAIKYMGDQPKPRIEIGTREENDKRVFFVQDNGMGIEERYHETIFGLFNKLHAQSEGTGIGLALVRRIIEHHGGKIWVESEGLGKGSTFCFYINPQHAS